MGMLEEAIAISARAHAGAQDKGGAPYILHPLRVMLRLATEAERIVGVLHDVIEDTDWTIEALRAQGFSGEVLEALDGLTRRPDETYEAFIRRAASNPIARSVKIADLEDNLDVTRISSPTKKDWARLEKYERALKFLQGQEDD